MSLLNENLLARFKAIGGQEDKTNPICVAKFFLPGHSATWYVCAYYPKARLFFGYVSGLGYDEYGYFSLDELESLKHPITNLHVERDEYFEETQMSVVRTQISLKGLM
jgi:hypothetical protein